MRRWKNETKGREKMCVYINMDALAASLNCFARYSRVFFARTAARAAGERDEISCQLDDLLMRRLLSDFMCRGLKA